MSNLTKEVAYFALEPHQLKKLFDLSDQLHSGTDKERDYGHRLWLVLIEVVEMPITKD
jgi:hypothetical protein